MTDVVLTTDDPPTDADVTATGFVTSDDPAIRAWAAEVTAGCADDQERAVALFLAVRDGWRYDPYLSSSDPDDYRAGAILRTDRNWCVPKSIVFAAGLRAVGIPARLGYADVRNHLSSEKLLEHMGTDLFVYHGYVAVWLDGRWFKVSSAFNIELCERFGTKVLEWDGTHDALMHPYDEAGARHMEYVRDRGLYREFPFDDMRAAFAEVYPAEMMSEDTGSDEAFHD